MSTVSSERGRQDRKSWASEFIAAKAEHPNAARLFADWTLSKEAQQLMIKLGRKASSRTDVETDVPKNVRFVPEDLSVYDRIEQVRAEVEKLLFR